jgi:hypothetical protein
MRYFGKPHFAVVIHISRLCENKILHIQTNGKSKMKEPLIGIWHILQFALLRKTARSHCTRNQKN